LGVTKLLERLPEAGDVTVSEDSPHARDEALLPAIALHVLPGHEPDDGLASRKSNRRHRGPPCNTSGLLRNRLQEGSIGWRRTSTDRNSCTARRGWAGFADGV